MNSDKEIWTIGSLLKWTGQYFASKGVDTSRLDAEVLLSHVLGKDRLYLYVHFDQPLNPDELAIFRDAVKKRAQRIPVAYITGCKEFMGYSFAVSPAVLIPRPDTEILVEEALKRLENMPEPMIADLGTGSGAIIISLLKKLPAARGVAVDISAAALRVAAENAAALGVKERLELLQGDMFQPLGMRRFDALLSNPPYIPAKDIEPLAAEVRYEPRTALDGGKDGLDFYRRIVQQGSGCLKPGGFIGIEIGIGQAGPIAALAEQTRKLAVEAVVPDYSGIERAMIMRPLEVRNWNEHNL